METLESYISLGCAVGLLLAVFFVCGWVAYRNWVKKEWINRGNRFLGEHIYSQFQNADSKEAIEHVQYVREEQREDEFIDEDK